MPRINDRLHLYPRFQWAALRGPEPRHDGESGGDEDIRRISPHYHFKCAESESDEGGPATECMGVEKRKNAIVGFGVHRHGSQKTKQT